MAVNFPNNPALNSTHTEAGYTWTWDGTSWTITGGSLVDFLNEVGDVNAPAPITDGHILKYDSTNSQWVPSPDTGGSSGSGSSGGIHVPEIDKTATSSTAVFSNNDQTATFPANGSANMWKDVKFKKFDNDKVYEFRYQGSSSGTGAYYGFYFSDKQSTRIDAATTQASADQISEHLAAAHNNEKWWAVNIDATAQSGGTGTYAGDASGADTWLWPNNGYGWNPNDVGHGVYISDWHFVVDMPRKKVWVRQYHESYENGKYWQTGWRASAAAQGTEKVDPTDPLSTASFFLRETGTGDYFFNFGCFIEMGGTGVCTVTAIDPQFSAFREIGGGSSSGGVPVGTIAVWSGETTDIPNGWALCDGQNGTPDLRDRFIIGAGVSGATTNYIIQITGTAQEGALENVFDGDLNTFALPNGEGANGITFSPTDWTTANSVTSLRIYCTRYQRTNDTSGKLWVNGVDYTSGVNGSTRDWLTISETDIQTIRWDKTGADGSSSTDNSYVLVFAIEVNGVVLTLPQYKSTGETGGSADAVVVEHKHTTSLDGGGAIPGAGGESFPYGGAGSYAYTTWNMDNAGEDGTGKNLPPYYALCYIMCTVVSPQASSLSVTQQPAQGTGTLTYSSINGVFQYTPPALNQTDWDTAYSWGDHSQAGYLTSFTETDPTVPTHVKSITQANITAWNAKSDVASLNDLSDVDTTGAANNKILKHNGTQWVVADDESGGGADGNTTYSLEALLSPGIKLTGSDGNVDNVFFDAGAGITLTRTSTSPHTIEFSATGGTLSGLTDTQILSQSDGDVLTWDNTAQLWKPQAGGAAQVNADWNANFGVAQILNKPTTIAGYGITDAFDGDFSSLTNVPTNFIVDGDFTTAGLMKTDGSGGYSIITDDSSTWNSTSATVASKKDDWDDAYSWGNHANQGYLTSDSDTTYTLGWAHGTNNQTSLILAPTGSGTSYTVNLIGGNNITFTGSGSNLTIDSAGQTGGGSDIPPSTKMLFVQSSAPTGWTKETDHNDKALRVVSGSASTGGSVNFTSAFQSQSVSGSVSGNVDYDNTSATSGGGGGMNVSLGHSDYSGNLAFSGATNLHTLVSGELPSHSHNFHRTRWATAAGGGGDPGAEFGTMNSGAWSETNTQNHGSSVGHNHTYQWLGANHRHTLGQINLPDHTHSVGYNHRHGVSLNINGNNINMAVKYVDVIICSKQ